MGLVVPLRRHGGRSALHRHAPEFPAPPVRPRPRPARRRRLVAGRPDPAAADPRRSRRRATISSASPESCSRTEKRPAVDPDCTGAVRIETHPAATRIGGTETWPGDANSTSSICSAAPRSAPSRTTSPATPRCPSTSAVDRLLSFERFPDDVDAKIGTPGYVGVTARAAGGFQPLTNIDDARQRWLFRMVHSERPLQEKMALFWHNHFATAYTKIAGAFGAAEATRMLAAKPSEDPNARRRADRAVPEVRGRQLPRPAGRGREGSGDAGVARRPVERARPAAGELRARADGAVHDGRRHVPGDRRLRRRARVHRLEPGAAGQRLLRVQPTTPASTTPTPRSSRSRSTRTAAARFRRAALRRACRTASI